MLYTQFFPEGSRSPPVGAAPPTSGITISGGEGTPGYIIISNCGPGALTQDFTP